MIEALIDFIVQVIQNIGYSGLFGLMALESTMVPIPSEVVMPFAGFLVSLGSMNLWIVLFVSTFGCLAGSLFSYALGYYGGEKFVRKFGKYFLLDESHLQKAEEWFKHRGGITIFLGRFVPGIRHVISIPAGIGKMGLLEFSFFTFIGAGIWNAFLLYMGIILEKNWNLILKYARIADIFVVVIILALICYYIFQIIKSRKNKL